jgi:type VI secretion system protein ImpH
MTRIEAPAAPQPLEAQLARLCADPTAFDPIMALRIAEHAARARGLRLDIRSGSGTGLAPVAIRSVSLTDTAIEVEADIIGLTGPLSPLPLAYTELAARDRRRRAGGLGAFLDLFAHRLTRHFAAATEKYSLGAGLQWARPGRNAILRGLRSLIGFGTPHLEDRMPLEGDTTLRYAGLLAQRTRSAMGLQALAELELGLPVRIRQFTLRWRGLAPEERTRMDGTARLGVDVTAGFFVPDRAGQCRIVIGPVRYADFLSLAKGQPRLERLRRLVRLYLGPVLDFDIQIILDRRDIPQTQLDGEAPSSRLGWNAWARAEPAMSDSDDAVIDGNDLPEEEEAMSCA